MPTKTRLNLLTATICHVYGLDIQLSFAILFLFKYCCNRRQILSFGFMIFYVIEPRYMHIFIFYIQIVSTENNLESHVMERCEKCTSTKVNNIPYIPSMKKKKKK